MEKIAQINQVQAIEKLTPILQHNDRIRDIVLLDAMDKYLVTNKAPELTGDGQIVAGVDTGVDTDHIMFKDKIKKKIDYGNIQAPDPKSLKGGEDYNGHGTHVAATVLESSLMVNSVDVRGMASKAQLIAQCIPLSRVPNLAYAGAFSIDQVIQDAFAAGAHVQNHSWGGSLDANNPEQPDYTVADAERVDRNAYKLPEMLIVFAAGNDGENVTDTDAQIGGYAAAKNALTVGASYTNRDLINGQKGNINETAIFSSRGPVIKTMRTKPDLVAPGVDVLSARSTSLQNHGNMQDWIKSSPVPDSWVQEGKQVVFCSGTSMAAPAVSGCAALIREALAHYFKLKDLWAPLIKALLINGADILKGDSREEGFGRVNMCRTLAHLSSCSVDKIKSGKASSGFWQDIMDQTKCVMTCRSTVPNPKKGGNRNRVLGA